MITPIIVPVNSEEESPPRCPHCDHELEGFEKADDSMSIPLYQWFVAFGLLGLIIVNFVGAMLGGMDASWRPCRPAFSERIDFIVPAYPASCNATRWLTQRTDRE